MTTILRSACGVFVAALLASVHAQPLPESIVSGEVVLATNHGVYVATVGSPFRVVKGTRLLATPAAVATVSPDGRYILVSLARRPGTAEQFARRTQHFYDYGRSTRPPDRPEFNYPVALHDLETGRTKELEDLSIRCATWAPDGHAFAFVSERGIGVFDVRSEKSKILVSSKRRLYETAIVSVDMESGVSVMSSQASDVIGRQECGPWIDSGSVAYRAFSGELPRRPDEPEGAPNADSAGIMPLEATIKPVPLGDVTILDASGDGRTLLVATEADAENAAVHVARVAGASLTLDARVPSSLQDCRFTQGGNELACVRRTGVATGLTVVDARSFAGIGGVDVAGLASWLWIGTRSERRALVVQHDRHGTDVAAIAVADAGRGTLTPVLDHAAISRVTGDTTGLRLLAWIPSGDRR